MNLELRLKMDIRETLPGNDTFLSLCMLSKSVHLPCLIKAFYFLIETRAEMFLGIGHKTGTST